MKSKRVLLIQGMGGRGLPFLYLASKLRQAGFQPEFYAPRFLPLKDIRPHAYAVAKRCQELFQTNEKSIALIGYSMGGLIALEAVLNCGAAPYVNAVIALGSPFQGTPFAAVIGKLLGCLLPALNQMAPGSEMLTSMEKQPSVKLYCIGGKFDAIAWGAQNSFHKLADKNIVLPSCHLTLPFVAADIVLSILKERG